MPTRTQATVVAVFRNISDAQAAAEDLERTGSVKRTSTSALEIAPRARNIKERAAMREELPVGSSEYSEATTKANGLTTRTPSIVGTFCSVSMRMRKIWTRQWIF
jgi:hypothetical protein